MCGIVGVWNRRTGENVNQAMLTDMRNALRHRGPDDAGLFVDGPIGLGHQRLAILDLSARGHQPMEAPNGRYAITFNGEIYNYRELRSRLASAGVVFRSQSDTEVLLSLLAAYGPAILKDLRGMFAFGFWDREREELLLARDPFGKKPLYYADEDGVFLFASEPKALLRHPNVSRDIDPAALTKYFLYEYVPSPGTAYRAVRQIPPGSYAIVTKTDMQIRQWWAPVFLPKHAKATGEALLEELDQRLATAVQRRLIADVPVGVFLSGGIDSSAIAWYMRRTTGSAPLHSFSVSFAERSFDESAHAQTAARALGTTHHDLRFTPQTFHESLSDLLPIFDEPFADASLLPTYAVSKFARPYITVALDGDGSDELLGGYGTFEAAVLAERLPRLTPALWNAVQRMVSLLRTSTDDFSFDFKMKTFVKGLKHTLPERNQVWLGSFDADELRALLTPDWQNELPRLFQDLRGHADPLRELDALDAVSLLTIHQYLANDILVKLDRATMSVALETRTPFLDLDFAEFALRLPAAWKWKKRILKRLMRGRLPASIIERPKKGFGIPLGSWLRGPLRHLAETTLRAEKLREDGILQPREVARLLGEQNVGKADHRKKLWTLLAFQWWYDRCIAHRTVAVRPDHRG